ncbi:unnamed protein product [Staurois parvus]|uniref:Uncharacterized protein n=1 Tax=Staurois parvus TaxID=386267 RepID=A0ABN9AJ66_9NEOB|nr:unnamed protein product [Staurois parvus]
MGPLLTPGPRTVPKFPNEILHPVSWSQTRGSLTTHGAPRAIGDHEAPVSSPTPKKAYERYQGHLMGPPTDPGPSGSTRVPEWSVCPCHRP